MGLRFRKSVTLCKFDLTIKEQKIGDYDKTGRTTE